VQVLKYGPNREQAYECGHVYELQTTGLYLSRRIWVGADTCSVGTQREIQKKVETKANSDFRDGGHDDQAAGPRN
jgi:hypothetical protein